MTRDEASQLRRDVPIVLAEVARHADRYDFDLRRGRRFCILRDALPRFGQGERVTPKHLLNLAEVAKWVWDFVEWAREYHPRLVEPQVRQAARRLLDALAAVDVVPAPPRRPKRR